MPQEPEFKFRRVDQSSALPLTNLLQLYCHDMSEWMEVETNHQGSYAEHFEVPQFWAEGGSVFMVTCGELPIGFAIVQSAAGYSQTQEWDLKEFFILRKYRRTGVGQAFATFVWNSIPSRWLVRVHGNNRPAVPFWRKVVGVYSNDGFDEEARVVNGHNWFHFSFKAH